MGLRLGLAHFRKQCLVVHHAGHHVTDRIGHKRVADVVFRNGVCVVVVVVEVDADKIQQFAEAIVVLQIRVGHGRIFETRYFVAVSGCPVEVNFTCVLVVEFVHDFRIAHFDCQGRPQRLPVQERN